MRRRRQYRGPGGPRRTSGAPRRYANFFDGWLEPWHFADIAATERRLAAAGFVDVEVSLEPEPTTFADADAYSEFVANVCVRHHLARLPRQERGDFMRELTAQALADTPALTLDYWRLNMRARRPA